MMDITFHYHPEWAESRIKFLLSLYPAEFWKGKLVLELAPMLGDIGAYFTDLGAVVHGVEGRQENVDRLNQLYPEYGKRVVCGNLDTSDWPRGDFDIIINFGLFYHLEHHHEEHLRHCVARAPLMFFETVIVDNKDDTLFFASESGGDQSLTSHAGTPTTSYIENRLTQYNARFDRYDVKELNGWHHHYDWKETGRAGSRTDGWARRFWVVKSKSHASI